MQFQQGQTSNTRLKKKNSTKLQQFHLQYLENLCKNPSYGTFVNLSSNFNTVTIHFLTVMCDSHKDKRSDLLEHFY